MSTARLVMAVSFLSFMAPQTLMKIAFVGTKATATSTTKTIQAAGRATNEGSVAKRADRSGLIDGMYSSCVVRFFFNCKVLCGGRDRLGNEFKRTGLIIAVQICCQF